MPYNWQLLRAVLHILAQQTEAACDSGAHQERCGRTVQIVFVGGSGTIRSLPEGIKDHTRI